MLNDSDTEFGTSMAVNTRLALKLDTDKVSQEVGTSTINVPSENAVTNKIKDIHDTRYFISATEGEQTLINSIISEVYVVGAEVTGVRSVIATYLGLNSTAFGGENSLGLQIVYRESGVNSEETNYYASGANLWVPNTLYELSLISEGTLYPKVRVFIRTTATYSWGAGVQLLSGMLFGMKDAGLGKDVVPFAAIVRRGYVLVAQDGSGDYTRVDTAAAYCPAETIIKIMPGVYYNEIVTGGYSKKLYYIGEDKLSTIIQNSLNNYDYAVFVMGSGCLKNLTLFANNASNIQEPNEEYALHVESSTLFNDSLYVENCIIKSSFGEPLGMGMRGGCTVQFSNCDFIMESPSTSWRAAVYFHDASEVQYAGIQNVSFRNCLIYSPNKDRAIRLQSQEMAGSEIIIEMIGTRIKCEGITAYEIFNYNSGTPSPSDFLGLINARLKETSWGNSVNIFNAE